MCLKSLRRSTFIKKKKIKNGGKNDKYPKDYMRKRIENFKSLCLHNKTTKTQTREISSVISTGWMVIEDFSEEVTCFAEC